jgi:hypothetical protein
MGRWYLFDFARSRQTNPARDTGQPEGAAGINRRQ